MKWDVALRIAGIIGVIVAYGVFTLYGEMTYPLVIAILGVIALVAPETLDKLPFGPSK
jgi:hypothetical protein